METSKEWFARAERVMPGGVNSPVRACRAVGGTPRFIRRAEGAYLWDIEGNRYIDYVGSWGPMLLGHNRPEIREAVQRAVQDGLSFGAPTCAEVEMAERLCRLVPAFEMVRMVNSGTEAVMSALRAARGYTGRKKIIKFAGCYHGHCDAMLVRAGSGLMTAGVPDSLGVPAGCAEDTLTARYNSLSEVRALFEENPEEIAAVIVEPVAANMGVVLPEEGFLQGLRELCTAQGSVLIFDEVITGFRLALSGAQGYYGVTPDLATFGKIIGGGMPVGCYGGRREIMELVAPAGRVYQAGTLSGNPVAMAAGLKTLSLLEEIPSLYAVLEARGDFLRRSIRRLAERYEIPCCVTGVGSLLCVFFTDGNVRDFDSAQASDRARYARWYHFLLRHGIYPAPSQFEAIFLSTAHSETDLSETLGVIESFFRVEAGTL